MSGSVLRRTAHRLTALATFYLIAVTPAGAQSVVDYAEPVPGCPNKFPTYASASAVCRPLDDKSCAGNALCLWTERSKRCLPKEGTISADVDPVTAKRLGFIDYVETMPFETLCAAGKPCEPGASEYMRRGQDYFQKQQFSSAIGEYSKALKENPNIAEALSKRALAYEQTGDRIAALADYCRILVIYSKLERRINARERIAALAGQPDARPAQGATAQPPATPPNLQPVPQPRTSTLDDGQRRGKIAPFSVEVGPGINYLVKIVNIRNERDQIVMFIKGGETYSTKVPLGEYTIRAAIGDVWYGKKDLFGPDTRFVRLRAKNSGQQSFVFYRKGNTAHGKRLILKKIMDPSGESMEEERISREQF